MPITLLHGIIQCSCLMVCTSNTRLLRLTCQILDLKDLSILECPCHLVLNLHRSLPAPLLHLMLFLPHTHCSLLPIPISLRATSAYPHHPHPSYLIRSRCPSQH